MTRLTCDQFGVGQLATYACWRFKLSWCEVIATALLLVSNKRNGRVTTHDFYQLTVFLEFLDLGIYISK